MRSWTSIYNHGHKRLVLRSFHKVLVIRAMSTTAFSVPLPGTHFLSIWQAIPFLSLYLKFQPRCEKIFVFVSRGRWERINFAKWFDLWSHSWVSFFGGANGTFMPSWWPLPCLVSIWSLVFSFVWRSGRRGLLIWLRTSPTFSIRKCSIGHSFVGYLPGAAQDLPASHS